MAFEPGAPGGALCGVAGVLVVPVGPASETSGEVGGVGRAGGPADVGSDDGEVPAGEQLQGFVDALPVVSKFEGDFTGREGACGGS